MSVDTPTVLFLCVHNAGRSQMAAGWALELGAEAVNVLSAGSAPGEQLNPDAVEAMAEVGVDIDTINFVWSFGFLGYMAGSLAAGVIFKQ